MLDVDVKAMKGVTVTLVHHDRKDFIAQCDYCISLLCQFFQGLLWNASTVISLSGIQPSFK